MKWRQCSLLLIGEIPAIKLTAQKPLNVCFQLKPAEIKSLNPDSLGWK